MEWTFLCIWYENRGFWVHEVKRLGFAFYMALCIPIHLRQRTSRVYQDHPAISGQVLTSLVPPVHNQGVSSAPHQGHALWKIFLPTTGSFFVCFITDFFLQQHFSVDVFLLHSVFSYRGWSGHFDLHLKCSDQPRITVFSCFFMLPLRFPVLRYLATSSDHHNHCPLSESCRRSWSAYMQSLWLTASFWFFRIC